MLDSLHMAHGAKAKIYGVPHHVRPGDRASIGRSTGVPRGDEESMQRYSIRIGTGVSTPMEASEYLCAGA